MIDRNKDGRISEEEFMNFFKKYINARVNDQELNDLFISIDTIVSSMLTSEEFHQLTKPKRVIKPEDLNNPKFQNSNVPKFINQEIHNSKKTAV